MAATRIVSTEDLTDEEVLVLRELLDAAWESEPDDFTEEDWRHAIGGVHFLLEEGGTILAHASVVPRELHTNGHELRTGYVEAVGTHPEHRRQGHASALLGEVAAHLDRDFQLGALGGDPRFYEPLGWRVWQGPTHVRIDEGLVRTPEEDGSVLVRFTPSTPLLDLGAPISCEWRPGEVW